MKPLVRRQIDGVDVAVAPSACGALEPVCTARPSSHTDAPSD
jgi:hypothetical protein